MGYARGKVGSVVFYRNEGEQVTRAYTSQISNPKTSAQNAQRAIFYTAQRWAAGAKYLIEQGQEGITNKTKARQAFLKRALNDIRVNYLTGNGVLNRKGNPYMQPQGISLTNGSITPINYKFAETLPGTDVLYPCFNSIVNPATITLQDFFDMNPSLGLGKQLTAVWLSADQNVISVEGKLVPNINPSNFKTTLHYAEIVFTSDESALSKNLFVEDEEAVPGVEFIFNPEVLAASWGGTDKGFGVGTAGMIQFPNGGISRLLAFALIVSDYSNGRWSRSNAPFVVSPSITDVSLYDIIATYGNDAAEVTGEEYLDQAEVVDEGKQAGLAPRTIMVNLVDADPISMTRSMAKSVSLSVDSASRIGIQITPMNGDYSADSASVTVSGTADDFTVSSPFLLPTAYGKAWVVDLQPTVDPEAGQTTIISINVGGATRTLTINWTASV